MSRRKSLARLVVEKTQERQKAVEEAGVAGVTVKTSSNARPLGHADSENAPPLSHTPLSPPSGGGIQNGLDASLVVRRAQPQRDPALVCRDAIVSSRHSYPAARGGGSRAAPRRGWQSPPPTTSPQTQSDAAQSVSSPKRSPTKPQRNGAKLQEAPRLRDPATVQHESVPFAWRIAASSPPVTPSRQRASGGGRVLLPDGSLRPAPGNGCSTNSPSKSWPIRCVHAESNGAVSDNSEQRSADSGSVRLRSSCKLPPLISEGRGATRDAAPAPAPAAPLAAAVKDSPPGPAAASPSVSAASGDSAPPPPLLTPRRSSMAHARSTNDLQSPEPDAATSSSPPATGSNWSSPLSVSHRARSFPAGLAGSVETLSSLSELSTGSPLSNITVQKARSRGYLVNNTGSALLLSAEELDACLPQRKLHLLVGTWNMNAKEPPACLDDLVLPYSLAFVPDMVVLGTQESHADHRGLLVRLQSTLGPSHVLFHSASLGTLHVCVFIRRDLIWYCSVPEEASYSIRQPTAIKTKGCVAVGFQFFGTTFLFLTCHLTAHLEKQNQRIDDVRRICAALDLPQAVPSRSQSRDVTERYDNVLWFGDLNFRLSQSRPRVIDTIVESSTAVLLREQRMSQMCLHGLLQWDQLNHAKQKGRAFEGFSEGDIAFLPTYKYDPGTNTFDTSSKQRIPAYTDRILFKSRRDAVRCVRYDSVHGFNTSDHKPVWGLYQCDVRPSMDNIPLAAGKFDRSVFLEGLQRRARHLPHTRTSDARPCSVQ